MAKAFKLKVDEGIGIVTFDMPGEKVNILTPTVLEELEKILEKLETRRDDLTGAIFISGKKDNFIAGADISVIEDLTDPEEGERLARKGQEVFARIEGLGFPTAAAIHGPCLGGGLDVITAWSLIQPKLCLVFLRRNWVSSPASAGLRGYPDLSVSPRVYE